MTTNSKNCPKAGPNILSEKEAFRELQKKLLDRLLTETETVHLHNRLKTAAIEAAALAWNTGFPLLVYPGLLAEKAQQVRIHNQRREQIWQRSQTLMPKAT